MKVEHIIRQEDAAYPSLLKAWDQAPAVLYCAGEVSLLNDVCIAIIGTRKPTQVGEKTAFQLARALATLAPDVVILSGLALGCDTQAHQGALAARGKTIAVFGTPLTEVYPPENRELAEQIVHSGGLVVSCYDRPASNSVERKRRFIARDWVQAALSRCVIPVQGNLTSGTRHAVEWAWKHDRMIAVPRPDAQDQARYPEHYALTEKYIDIKANDANAAIQIVGGRTSCLKLIASITGE